MELTPNKSSRNFRSECEIWLKVRNSTPACITLGQHMESWTMTYCRYYVPVDITRQGAFGKHELFKQRARKG